MCILVFGHTDTVPYLVSVRPWARPLLDMTPVFLVTVVRTNRQRSMCKDCGGSSVSPLVPPFDFSLHCHDGGFVSGPCRHGGVASVTLITRVLWSGRLEVYSCIWTHGYRTLCGVCSAMSETPPWHDPPVSGDSCAIISDRETSVRTAAVVRWVLFPTPSPSPRTVMTVVACPSRTEPE